jgi:hypothetical protein
MKVMIGVGMIGMLGGTMGCQYYEDYREEGDCGCS